MPKDCLLVQGMWRSESDPWCRYYREATSTSEEVDTALGLTMWGLYIFAALLNMNLARLAIRLSVSTPLKLAVCFYAMVCAWRAIFLNDTAERLCFFNTWPNYAFVNRSLAACGEISFGSSGGVIARDLLQKYTPDRSLARWFAVPLCIVLSILATVANCLCFTAMLKKQVWWHLLEESLWAVYGSLSALMSVVVYFHIPGHASGMRSVLLCIAFASIFWAAYIIIIDLPMYVDMSRREEERGYAPKAFLEGVKDSMQCAITSQLFTVWEEVWLWQVAYYLAGPFLLYRAASLTESKSKAS
ncbi:hypothetical protein CYMTET_37869 [Cymbomonas tetramitiformis]|uniref:Uncharacterized protein n=1 Tax=Cymbomonas tetramitiformis TaxID=36881 RepID=A0AAE0CD37_9CHLO|nr:hypothetical protein CYMTET_37869 [Cymbomonas tetramitiformis]|eukprot:gene27960-34567_t